MHPSWVELLAPEQHRIDSIFQTIAQGQFLPPREQVFRALDLAIDDVRAIILGQDPYPTPGMAEGFSFSVSSESTVLPPSLKNIFGNIQMILDYRCLALAISESGAIPEFFSSIVFLP